MTSFEFKTLMVIASIGSDQSKTKLDSIFSEDDVAKLLNKGLIEIMLVNKKEWYTTTFKANRLIDRLMQVIELID